MDTWLMSDNSSFPDTLADPELNDLFHSLEQIKHKPGYKWYEATKI